MHLLCKLKTSLAKFRVWTSLPNRSVTWDFIFFWQGTIQSKEVYSEKSRSLSSGLFWVNLFSTGCDDVRYNYVHIYSQPCLYRPPWQPHKNGPNAKVVLIYWIMQLLRPNRWSAEAIEDYLKCNSSQVWTSNFMVMLDIADSITVYYYYYILLIIIVLYFFSLGLVEKILLSVIISTTYLCNVYSLI